LDSVTVVTHFCNHQLQNYFQRQDAKHADLLAQILAGHASPSSPGKASPGKATVAADGQVNGGEEEGDDAEGKAALDSEMAMEVSAGDDADSPDVVCADEAELDTPTEQQDTPKAEAETEAVAEPEREEAVDTRNPSSPIPDTDTDAGELGEASLPAGQSIANSANDAQVLRNVEIRPQAPSLTAELHQHQEQGISWMVHMYDRGMPMILGDQMGLGKTVQTIGFLAYLRDFYGQAGPHLIVVPLSVMSNWLTEIERFCPTFRAIRFHGQRMPCVFMCLGRLN
jgi:hypothetical protein